MRPAEGRSAHEEGKTQGIRWEDNNPHRDSNIYIFILGFLSSVCISIVDMIAYDIGGVISDIGMADKKDFPAVDIVPNPAFGSFLRNFQLRQQTLPRYSGFRGSVAFATEVSEPVSFDSKCYRVLIRFVVS